MVYPLVLLDSNSDKLMIVGWANDIIGIGLVSKLPKNAGYIEQLHLINLPRDILLLNEVKVSIEHKQNKLLDEQASYMTVGSNEPLVLIHGWGVSSAIWSLVVKQLSQHYCVYLVDLPGIGEQPELDDYALKNIAEILLRKLPKQAVWCGWSLGGLVATYVACHFPDRVTKLVQISASLKFVEEGDWLGVKKDVFELFKENVSKQPQKTLNRFLSLQAMGSETVKTDIATIKKLIADQPEPKLSALVAGLDLLNTVDLRTEFSQLRMPCLILLGELDGLVPIANAPSLIKLNPLQQQVIFKSSSHAPFISESEKFIKVLIGFINH